MPSNPLQQLPQSLKRLLPKKRQPPKLSPRQRARSVVQALQDATLQCLREQQHIISQDRYQRQEMLLRLAQSFAEGDWHPADVAREDIDVIPAWLITSIVVNLANGIPVGGYELAIYERYEQLDTPGTTLPAQAATSMPQVQNPWRSGAGSYRRAYPRGKLPES